MIAFDPSYVRRAKSDEKSTLLGFSGNPMEDMNSDLTQKMPVLYSCRTRLIDLLAILQKSLDRATFLYIFMRKLRLNGVRASITIVHVRKFYKL